MLLLLQFSDEILNMTACETAINEQFTNSWVLAWMHSKRETSTQYCLNAGPPSAPLAQH